MEQEGCKQFKLFSLRTFSPAPQAPAGLTPFTLAGGNWAADQLSLLPEQMSYDGQSPRATGTLSLY